MRICGRCISGDPPIVMGSNFIFTDIRSPNIFFIFSADNERRHVISIRYTTVNDGTDMLKETKYILTPSLTVMKSTPSYMKEISFTCSLVIN